MHEFPISDLLSAAEKMGRMSGFNPDQPLGESAAVAGHAIFLHVKEELARTGYTASAATAGRMAETFKNKRPVTYYDLAILSREFYGRLNDKMKATAFLSLSMRETEEYKNPLASWESVVGKYSSAILDIEEAGKCLALGRYTACVFHLMRLVECGLRSLGAALNDPRLDPKQNPSWETILRKCDKELQKPLKDRCIEWKTDEPFFSTATANLRAVKDAWRNPTMHVEKHYDGEEAREIYSATRAFMRHLASKLSE
jgi:hypothetical protein